MKATSRRDTEFMARLYERYAGLMFETAYGFNVRKHEAEDIVSESLVALLRNIETLRGLKPKPLSAYIVTCVRRAAINYLSREALRCRKESEAARLSRLPEVDEMPDIGDQRILRAVNGLPPRERACITLKFISDKSNEEIAEETGLSPSGIRKYLSRARKRLKNLLDSEEEGGDAG